jgi:beta-aspartyl-peptidase (threonine type)
MFIRAAAAHEICARMRLAGESGKAAGDAVMAEVKTLGGSGGVIVVSPKGEMSWSFNTPGMYRGKADASGRMTALYGDEDAR